MQRHNVQSRVIPTYFLDATFLYRIEVVFAYGLHRTFVVISDELGHSTVVIFVRMYIMLFDPFSRDLTKKHRKSKGNRYRDVLVLVFLCACLSFACCEIRDLALIYGRITSIVLSACFARAATSPVVFIAKMLWFVPAFIPGAGARLPVQWVSLSR